MHNIFRFLGHTKDAKSQAEKCIAEARRRAMLGSHLVWCFRGRDDWDFQETIGSWRGHTEVDNIAAADRIRQKEEQEKQTREGTWTDWSNQEPEESPDKQLEQMEWQIKTQARKNVREAAEAEGLVCYYPDGSYKDGRPFWLGLDRPPKGEGAC